MHHGSPRSSCQELHLRHNHWQREVHQQSLLFAHTRDWILLLGRWRCRQSRLSTSQGDMRETMANRSWLYSWQGRGKRNDTVTVCQSICVEKCLSFWIQKCYLKVITRMTRRITCVASINFDVFATGPWTLTSKMPAGYIMAQEGMIQMDWIACSLKHLQNISMLSIRSYQKTAATKRIRTWSRGR